MSVRLEEVKNLKIVPENFESATFFDLVEAKNDTLEIILTKASNEDLQNYKKGEKIEAFGSNNQGIIYFEAEILDKNENKLLIKRPLEITEIQRRKYSRVPFNGKIIFESGLNVKVRPEDISAGGCKFASDTPFMVGSEYNIKIELENNLTDECSIQPIRVEETEDGTEFRYSISTKFKKIKSIDRIALMQYSLKLISEKENKA